MGKSGMQRSAIIDIRLFGSAARGDFDNSSDIDVLIVTNEGKPDIKSIEQSPINQLKGNVDISIYSMNRLKSMFLEGHLFSWHLHQESRHLEHKGTIDSIAALGTPNPYNSASTDTAELLALLDTIRSEVKSSNSLTFEAGLIYVCARNIALSASWHTGNGIKFGRNSPFEVAAGKSNFPLSRADYDMLVACRHASTRGTATVAPSRSWLEDRANSCHQWASEVNEWIVECEKCQPNAGFATA
ncbi:nucleotidyltransferase domain-containing protein [Burkholderia ubonensis]|uniref:nucleotidyltransferase domain-containing protein n=1 Tax=Burkholderia ubonensis TaxID=101571 RepID=UPI0009B30411|nr:nucleotidyltransferase domain-containing protein [Burkholderia ubonensis]